MNMGKRLKAELEERGMKPVDLCELIPELGIGTLSALYNRDSKYSDYATSIADALGLELRWLLTGDFPKYAIKRDEFSRYKMSEREENIQKIEQLLRNEINDDGVKSVLRMAQGAAEDFPINKQTNCVVSMRDWLKRTVQTELELET